MVGAYAGVCKLSHTMSLNFQQSYKCMCKQYYKSVKTELQVAYFFLKSFFNPSLTFPSQCIHTICKEIEIRSCTFAHT